MFFDIRDGENISSCECMFNAPTELIIKSVTRKKATDLFTKFGSVVFLIVSETPFFICSIRSS